MNSVDFYSHKISFNSNSEVKYVYLDEVDSELISSKDRLDKVFKTPFLYKKWKKFDFFKNEKTIIPIISGAVNVTNAWVKCFELINYYKLTSDWSEIIHFDNACFPGSFILATHHYCVTNNIKYKFYGSSLIEKNELDSKPLEDTYKLYENYKNNFLMNAHNNGDTANLDNIKDFIRQIGGKVDLYTSDLGFDVSDYNQEQAQLVPHIGQILAGVLTLKPGGNFVVKQYTFFNRPLQRVITICSQLFDEFYVCKPMSSRPTNSETYLVGKGLKKGISIKHILIQELINIMFNNVSESSLVYDFTEPLNFLATRQSKCIDDFFNNVELDFDTFLRKWYFNNCIKYIDSAKLLKVKPFKH